VGDTRQKRRIEPEKGSERAGVMGFQQTTADEGKKGRCKVWRPLLHEEACKKSYLLTKRTNNCRKWEWTFDSCKGSIRVKRELHKGRREC